MGGKNLKIGIVCGCLPNQGGMNYDELYHQVLQKNIWQTAKINVQVSSVWYTTLAESDHKVAILIEKENPDIILYHVRPDPFLRLTKLLIKYKDKSGRKHVVLNITANDSTIKEKDYTQILNTQREKKSIYKTIFRTSNIIAGYLLGTYKNAVLKEKIILNETVKICKEQNKHLIIIGPASRPSSIIENFLLKKLEAKLYAYALKLNTNYVTCFGVKNVQNENLFIEDGIHVSKTGHIRIANLVFPHIKKIIHE